MYVNKKIISIVFFIVLIATVVSTVGAANWTQTQKLMAGDSAVWDVFGCSVSLDDDTVLIGAFGDSDLGAATGSAYVFTRIDTTWIQQQKLIAYDHAAEDWFGWSVSLDGDTALIGAQMDGDNGYRSGSAYIFTRTGTTWTFQQKLLASDGAAEDFFGCSVSLDGDTALIGAYGYGDEVNNYSNRTGAVYVFTRNSSIWTQQAKLQASDGATSEGTADDEFGISVSLDGDTALIGADCDYNDNRGSAYVFTRTDITWTQQTKLLAGDGGSSDYFGSSVSLDGDTALIGAYGNDDDKGAAYVFTRTDTTWIQQAKLLASDSIEGIRFASSGVSLSGDIALIGRMNDDNYKGSAYVFTRTGTTWAQQQKLLASDGETNDRFASSVSVSGDNAFIGANYDDSYKGAVYMFTKEGGWENNLPVADAGNPYYANVGNSITFDGSASSDTDGTIEGYRWDFTNDGTYDTDWSTSPTTTHSYPAVGTYTVKLEVKDDAGGNDTDTANVTISTEGGAIPTADANGPYSGYVNYPVSFSSAGSIGGSEGTIVSWYWTFGDGVVSSAQNPSHIYTTAGTFTVTLKVTNNYGETDIDTTSATITGLSPTQKPPVADAGGPYIGVVGSPITFDGSGSNDSDGTIINYGWNFGDGTAGMGVSPTHTYTSPGNYTVILTVTDNESLTHSNATKVNINVSGPPTIVISIDISNIEPIEEENEKTIPVSVFCYHQSVSNIHLEILDASNLTITLLSPNITLNPGENRVLLIKIKAPKLERNNNSENKVSDETIVLRAVGDGNVTSNTEQINLKVIEKNATPGFETIATITAIGTAGALVTFFRRRNGNR